MAPVPIIEGILAAALVLLLTWGTTCLKRALLGFALPDQNTTKNQERSEMK